MKSNLFSARAGAIGSTLGALLALCGYILLSHNTPINLQSWSFLFGPVLIVLVMSAYCWFWKVGRVFLTLGLLIIFLALLWHGYLNFVYAIMRCFMLASCPPVPLEEIFGLGLPYVGYLLSGLGLIIAYTAHRSKTRNALYGKK